MRLLERFGAGFQQFVRFLDEQFLARGRKHGGQLLPKPGRVEEMQAVIDRLTEENAKLLEQREVLKKSLGILSEAPPRSMPKSQR